jgi:4-hydroxybenzoyl-CoA thioesterase
MAYTSRLAVRFADVDYARVVYFPRFFDFCHRVFEDFFADELKVPYARLLEERNIGFPAVHAEADYRAPLRFGDTARVVLETLKVSARSAQCRYRLYRGESEELCATVLVVTAAIAIDTFKGSEFPADVRAVLEKHLVSPEDC